MIRFKELRWGNVFSYGPNNVLNFENAQLTQIIGKNGHGKSSIALILEEVLYNQNSKKIKKADILNRYSKDKTYFIELDFSNGESDYTIKTVRTSATSTVKLYKDGKDISNHTATGTFKAIELIIGYDFKTFGQIIYQSSPASLEFLTATDTARKKFLIDLLDQEIYTRACDVFKSMSSELTKKVDTLQGKIDSTESWLNTYSTFDLTEKTLLEVPEFLSEESSKLTGCETTLANIEAISKKIIQNNQYKQILDGLVLNPNIQNPPTEDYIVSIKFELSNLKLKLSEGSKLQGKNKSVTYKCVTCGQDVDNSTNHTMFMDFEAKRPNLEAEILKYESILADANKVKAAWDKEQRIIIEWEKYSRLFDPGLSQVVPDKHSLLLEIARLKKAIATRNEEIRQAQEHNVKAAAHNSKVQVISEQITDMKNKLRVLQNDMVDTVQLLSEYQILVKAFSTTGLVAYKIEVLVKDLEEATNKYLSILADGRFQLSFKVSASDKLNVVITDNGCDVDIVSLSSGERSRVAVATLLAIRSIMQALSKTRSNLLILDETIENLDIEGKEKLIEILLAEENLNTFIISHGFSHPLLEKLRVFKNKNISRIEHG